VPKSVYSHRALTDTKAKVNNTSHHHLYSRGEIAVVVVFPVDVVVVDFVAVVASDAAFAALLLLLLPLILLLLPLLLLL